MITDLVQRFYAQVWNQWDAAAARELLHESLTFRGSLGRRTVGVDEFLEYVDAVRTAFPDFHNQVDDVLVQGEQAVARLTWTGTHRGAVLGHAPTGNRIEYHGIAWFKLRDGEIVDAYVLGDIDALRAQLAGGRAGG